MEALRQDRTAEQQNSRAAEQPNEVTMQLCGCEPAAVVPSLVAAMVLAAAVVIHGVLGLFAASNSTPQPTRMASLSPALSQPPGARE